MLRNDSLEKTLMLGKIEGGRRRGRQSLRWLDGITYLMDMNLSNCRELVMDREGWYAAVHWAAKNWTWLSDWTELSNALFLFLVFFSFPVQVTSVVFITLRNKNWKGFKFFPLITLFWCFDSLLTCNVAWYLEYSSVLIWIPRYEI